MDRVKSGGRNGGATMVNRLVTMVRLDCLPSEIKTFTRNEKTAESGSVPSYAYLFFTIYFHF